MLATVLLIGSLEARLLSSSKQASPLPVPDSSQQQRHYLSRVDQLSQELHINEQDPNQDIRTNVALNLEWGI
ncbi:hypothetical protein ACA910_018823 [Epithemia clementina (nom. ined.)]